MTDTPKPKPKKLPRAKSREYLEAALDKAREVLPGWMYAMIHDAALPSSGGRARAGKRKAQAAALVAAGIVKADKVCPADAPLLREALAELGITVPEAVTKSAPAKLDADSAMGALIQSTPLVSVGLCMSVVSKNDDGTLFVELHDSDYLGVVKTAEGLDVKPGDQVLVEDEVAVRKSDRLFPDTEDRAFELEEYNDVVEKMASAIGFEGPTDAPLLFITAAPNALEAARREALVGDDGRTFQEHYLAPLGLTKADIGVGFVSPHWCPDPVDPEKIAPWLKKARDEIARFPHARVVAVGKVAKAVLGNLASVSLPHPSAVRKRWDTEELDRKLKAIAKTLDRTIDDGSESDQNRPTTADPSQGWVRLHLTGANGGDEGSLRKFVSKAAGEKQIVYGVVLDPYTIDSQGDWVPPAEIEKTAHEFLKNSRVTGLEHRERARANVVESWVEPYPTDADYKAAQVGMPHKVSRRDYGTDVVCSGTWMIGMELSDDLWADYQAGKINGFSIGGFSTKTEVDIAMMPKVTYVDLVPRAL